ncbi:MAG: hypothetical protein JWP01_3958 [Myxococcales bacterium]|nr:hypothetical protein [Myxococcales bacterium]
MSSDDQILPVDETGVNQIFVVAIVRAIERGAWS